MLNKIPKNILLVRKMSSLEYYYGGKHKSREIRESAQNHDANLRSIEAMMDEAGVEFRVVTRRKLARENISSYDALISAGGDGTSIAAAFFNRSTPQLNLRTDTKSVGALCKTDICDSLRSLLSGQYALENWTRQEVYLNGNFVGRALNEVCIGEGLKFSKLAKYNLSFVDARTGLTRTERQSASGLIIATGTGSTGWPKAFKPFPRDSNYFKFRNLLLHSGDIESGKSSEFRIEYKGHEGKFAIDTVEFDFPRDAVLEIKTSAYPLKVIIPKKEGE